jgi:single-strand DNA-binding protein
VSSVGRRNREIKFEKLLKRKVMNTLKNKVQLIGNLGNAPEVKILDGGSKLARLSLATNETYKNSKGEKVTETQWHNVIAWGKTAEIVEKYFTKGIEVMIEGKLISRNYTDKEGVKRYITEVQANELLILSKK